MRIRGKPILAAILFAVAGSAMAHASEHITNLREEGWSLFETGYRGTGMHVTREALALAETRFGEDSPEADAVALNLARMYAALGVEHEAARLFRRVGGHLRARDDEDERLALIEYELGHPLTTTDPKTAIDHLEKALRIMRKHEMDTLEKADPLYIRGLYQLAYGHLWKHDAQRALRLYSRALETSKEFFGEDAMVTAEAYYAKAQYYVSTGRHGNAEEHFTAALDIFKDHFPEDNVNILAIHAALVPVYEELEDDVKATDHLMVLAEKMPDTDGQPVPIYRVAAKYPRVALFSGSEGYAILRFRIRKDGHVDKVTVIDGDEDSPFTEAAMESVEQWRYKPRIVDGVPVESYTEFRWTFEMEDRKPTGSHIVQ